MTWIARRFEKYRSGLQARFEQSIRSTGVGGVPIAQPNWQKLGNESLDAGHLNDAARCYQNILKNSPDDVSGLVSLAFVKSELGLHDESRGLLERAVTLDERNFDAWFMLGCSHEQDNNFSSALACYSKAIEMAPDFLPAHIHQGLVFHKQGNSLAAISVFQRALELSPHHPQVLSNLGGAYQVIGQLQSAIACYRQALEAYPDYLPAEQNLLYALSFSQGCSPAQYLNEARRFGLKVSALARPYANWLCEPVSVSDRPLRIGFVSGDLRNHSVGYFLEGVLAKIEPERFRLIAYSNWPIEDDLTMRIKPFFAQWNKVNELADDILAARIHSDKIDILIDLSGHTAANRLSVFAWRPAPLQVTWLGYWASTGVSEIDYILVDGVSLPESAESEVSEKVCRLPDIRYCFTVPFVNESIGVTNLPASRKGYVTFASFQVLSKINDAVLLVWSRILTALPTARLRIQTWSLGSSNAQNNFFQRLNSLKINRDQFDLFGGSSREKYLASYSEIDVVLDTFPFPGGTTTAEALWMGVPTLTLSGQTMLERQGESILRCAGLADWVASSEQDYVERALIHVENLVHLSELRETLRQRVEKSPLFDAGKFAKNFEFALTQMWLQKCNLNPRTTPPALPDSPTRSPSALSQLDKSVTLPA